MQSLKVYHNIESSTTVRHCYLSLISLVSKNKIKQSYYSAHLWIKNNQLVCTLAKSCIMKLFKSVPQFMMFVYNMTSIHIGCLSQMLYQWKSFFTYPIFSNTFPFCYKCQDKQRIPRLYSILLGALLQLHFSVSLSYSHNIHSWCSVYKRQETTDAHTQALNKYMHIYYTCV